MNWFSKINKALIWNQGSSDPKLGVYHVHLFFNIYPEKEILFTKKKKSPKNSIRTRKTGRRYYISMRWMGLLHVISLLCWNTFRIWIGQTYLLDGEQHTTLSIKFFQVYTYLRCRLMNTYSPPPTPHKWYM